jgi:hypothetical protein
MSECGITLKLGTDDASKSLDLILGFQSLYALQSQDAETIKPVMAKYFGQSFVDIVYAEVSSEEHVREYAKFLSPKLIGNIGQFMFMLKTRTTNESRLWQDSYEGDVATKEIAPSQFKLTTRSQTGGSCWDEIEIYYDSDENYHLKAAVFATALESAGFDVEEMSTWNEYEPSYD